MNSNTFDRIAFYSLLVTLGLLPLFFIPFSRVPIETSKSLLVVFGIAVTVVSWCIARFFDGKISFPKSFALFSAFGITVVALLSALFSPAVKLSLFGTLLDNGSFFFLLVGFLILLFASIFTQSTKRGRAMLWTLSFSFFALFLFQLLRLAAPEFLSFGVLSGKTGTILGSWNALGVLAGLAGIVSLFSAEFILGVRIRKAITLALLLLSIILLTIINFTFAWGLLAVFSLVIFVLKVLIYVPSMQSPERKTSFPLYSLGVLVLSILFFMSGPAVQTFVPKKLGVSNTEVRPSFGATMWVAQETLKKDPLLGAGPNRFSEMWALHKPGVVNESQFWNINFDFGAGIIPTLAVTLGGLGVLGFLSLIVFLVRDGAKSLIGLARGDGNFGAAIFFLSSTYLLASALFYPVGPAILFLTFASVGAFIGLNLKDRPEEEIRLSFLEDPRKSFFSIIFLVLFIIVTIISCFKFGERFAGVVYYTRALSAAEISSAETLISKALSLNNNDLFFRTQSQMYMAKLSLEASKTPEPSEAQIAELQVIFNNAINSAMAAAALNPTNYLNFQALGVVYEMAGTLGVPGSYDKALEAYRAASNLNPLNPGLKLSLARAYWMLKQPTEAKEYARQAFTLKPNYIEALVFLSQVAKSEGDTKGAQSYADRALSFDPQNPDLLRYVESLRTSGASNKPPANDNKE